MILITKKRTKEGEQVNVYEGEFDYYGRILSPELVQSFKKHHNTIMSYAVYKAINDDNKLIKELNKLTGEDCEIKVCQHLGEKDMYGNVDALLSAPTVVINRKHHYWMGEDRGVFTLYDHEDVVLKLTETEVGQLYKEIEAKLKAPITSKYLQAKKIFKDKYDVRLIKDHIW